MAREQEGPEPPDTHVTFGTLLKRLRVARGLSQEALAERASLSVAAISALESGRRQAPYRETVALLARSLDLEPQERARLEAAVSRRRGPPWGGMAHNLPVPTTSLVGRERDVAAAVTLLRCDPRAGRGAPVRLLTLTGPGGVGKTRLALAAAEALLPDYPDGVWLVDLAPLADPALVVPAVATTLGVRERAGRVLLASLTASVAGKTLLLVLDNCEHLVTACAALGTAVLRACPGLRLLATSREGLAIAGETRYRVPSLACPDPAHLPAATALPSYAAVDLLLQRCQDRGATVTLTTQTAPAVASICARLDGIPLALELAAARLDALGVVDLAARLDRSFHLLTGGSRTALPRQQTLRATVEWSYGLLSAQEQLLFDRLAVFAGGFTLQAAEVVCAGSGIAGDDVAALLALLVEKSLLLVEERESGVLGYRLLETLRQYGQEQGVLRGELEELRQRHAAWYLTRAVEAGGQLLGPEQARWLDRLEHDHANLRAALTWAIARQEAELALRLAANLSFFWYFRGHYTEGRALRTAALALPAGPAQAALRAEVLYGTGLLALHQGDYAAARAYLDEGLAIARTTGDARVLAPTLSVRGFVARVQEDYATARAALGEALALARAVGDPFVTAMALHHLGLIALDMERDLAAAWALNEQSLALFRQSGNHRLAGNVLTALGRVARARGDAAAARMVLAEAVAAESHVGDIGQIPRVLCVLAALHADAGRYAQAVQWASAAEAMEESLGSRSWPAMLRERDAWLGPAHEALGDEGFARAWAQGQAMTAHQILAGARDDLPPAPSPPDAGTDAVWPERPPAVARSVPRPASTARGAALVSGRQKMGVAAWPHRPARPERQAWALEHVRRAGPLSPRAYAAALAVSTDTARRDLQALVDQGVLQAAGTTRDRCYRLASLGGSPRRWIRAHER